MFKPYPHQRRILQYLLNGGLRAVWVCHRRAGKDLTLFNATWMLSQKRVGTYFYFYPTYAQAKKAIWLGMDEQGHRFLDYIPAELIADRHDTELRLTMTNGSMIQLIGSDNIDSVMSTNPVGAVFSEYALQNPDGWKYISPILRKNGGWAAFVYTPRGHNHGYDLYMNTKDEKGWFVERLTIEDTGLISPDDLDEERRAGIPEELIQQEYYCSFSAHVEGSYFSTDLKRVEDEGRLVFGHRWNRAYPVHTAWDFGMNDYTAVWFFQYTGQMPWLVDYYTERGHSFEHYVGVLREKGYVYGSHLAPHDVTKHEFVSGASVFDVALNYGIFFTRVPRTGKPLQVQAAHTVLTNAVFFMPQCEKGYESLGAYEREWDSKNMVHKNTPKHNWASHGADAFMTLACGLSMVELGAGLERRVEHTLGAGFNPLKDRPPSDVDIYEESYGVHDTFGNGSRYQSLGNHGVWI